MATVVLDHCLACPHKSSEELWSILHECIVDSDRTPVWPQHLNRLQCPAPQLGSTILATYRGPFGRIQRTVEYFISDWSPPKHFTYKPGKGHPFKGAISVEVRAAPTGSVLHWHGKYTMPGWRPERFFLRFYFEPRFFRHLGWALAQLR